MESAADEVGREGEGLVGFWGGLEIGLDLAAEEFAGWGVREGVAEGDDGRGLGAAPPRMIVSSERPSMNR
jgi:hypothetical protein